MEKSQGIEVNSFAESPPRLRMYGLVLGTVSVLAFAAGLAWSLGANAAEPPASATDPNARIVYPKKTELDFEGAAIEGELRNPGEFYFQHRPEEKFDSLVKRRRNFHREMLRDAVLSK